MYPFIRLIKEFAVHRNAAALGLLDTHVSHHVCWPWDLDPWRELNNGRSLTLYDLGRLPLVKRTGLAGVIRAHGWGMTMAGASVRWRRRTRVFERLEMRSRCVGWDARFFYIEQTMWDAEVAKSSILYRVAVTGRDGIVTPDRVMAAFPGPVPQPDLPAHVVAWIAAEAERPWPPAR